MMIVHVHTLRQTMIVQATVQQVQIVMVLVQVMLLKIIAGHVIMMLQTTVHRIVQEHGVAVHN
jgi:hypothetical protein